MRMDWMIYVVVGLVVGLNLGYIAGIRRGVLMVVELVGGVLDGLKVHQD